MEKEKHPTIPLPLCTLCKKRRVWKASCFPITTMTIPTISRSRNIAWLDWIIVSLDWETNNTIITMPWASFLIELYQEWEAIDCCHWDWEMMTVIWKEISKRGKMCNCGRH